MKEKKEEYSRFVCFDHIRFWVGNAKQAAHWYCINFGFYPFAYRGLETGSRRTVAHAIKQNKIIFVFESALLPENEEIGKHLIKHGDGVKDVAFEVDNLDWIIEKAKNCGGKIIEDIYEDTDVNGSVRIASIQTYGDTIHTLIERKRYKGIFLPGFKLIKNEETIEPLLSILPSPELNFIDHCVGNQPTLMMETVAQWFYLFKNIGNF